MIYLCCSSNAPYLPRIRPYLASVQAVCNAEIIPALIAVDCDPGPAYWQGLERWACASIPRALLTFQPPLDHTQAGDFVRFLPTDDADDVIIFTDGDIVMQRPFSAVELDWMRALPTGALSVGWNAGPGDTLLDEAQRLHPMVQLPSIAAKLPAPCPPCYNTGVMIGRRDTWQALFRAFLDVWPWAQATFRHYAAQQWALCYTLAVHPDLRVELLSQAIHTHGCYPLPEGAAIDKDGLLAWQGEPVVFKHHL